MQRIATALVLLLAFAAALASAQPAPAYRIIVHPKNPVASVARGYLADVFLKKVARWGHGGAIRPADQVNASVRQKFTQDVLRRSAAAVRSYWQQMIFSGRGIPPPELESDEAVIRFVLSNPGAIGYVSGEADVGSVKTLRVR